MKTLLTWIGTIAMLTLVLSSAITDAVLAKSEVAVMVGVRPEGTDTQRMQAAQRIVPAYGGTLWVAVASDPGGFDDASLPIYLTPTLSLTNEDLMMGDWAKGPSGEGDTSWAYSTMMPTPDDVTGCLAETWEVDEAASSLVFHIRHGVHFQNKPPTNGREVNANDIVFSLTRTWQSPRSYQYSVFPWASHIHSITASDNWTVIVECLPGKLATVYEWAGSATKIVPPEAVLEYGDLNDWHNSCGTGPFMLADYVAASSVTFVKNQSYWGHDPMDPSNQLPYVDSVRWLVIQDPSTRIVALRTGKIDMLDGLAWDDAQQLMSSSPELQWSERPAGYGQGTSTALFMRTDRLPFQDIQVRKALALAVDNTAVKDALYGGHADLLAWPVMPSVEFADTYVSLESLPESTQELYGYDPDKARLLLAEAGYPDGFKTNVVCNNGVNDVNLVSLIKSYLAAIGVDMEIKPYDMGTWMSIGLGKTYSDMYAFPADSVRPFLVSNLAAGSTYNFSMVSDPVVENTRQSMAYAYFNEPLKRNIMQDTVPYILNQAYVLAPPQPHVFTAWQPWVAGYHGEQSVGFVGATGNFPKYIWLAEPGDAWSLPMMATTPSAGSNTGLALGTRFGATDGYDRNLDIPHPPPGPNITFDAYFSIDDLTFSDLDRDYRAVADSNEWILHAESDDEEITLSWDANGLPAGLYAFMNTGTRRINMKYQNNVVLPAGEYDLPIVVSAIVPVQIPVKAGWNMVSVPVLPQDTSVNTVFPGSEAVYWWDPGTKSYVPVSNIEPQKGYWVAMLGDTTYTVAGVPVYTWTANLTAGWNMVGSLMGGVSFTNPNDNPDGSVEAFGYRWDPVSRSYIFDTSIEPGKGYWVAATRDCTLTVP